VLLAACKRRLSSASLTLRRTTLTPLLVELPSFAHEFAHRLFCRIDFLIALAALRVAVGNAHVRSNALFQRSWCQMLKPLKIELPDIKVEADTKD
jgi:hypothetical protein